VGGFYCPPFKLRMIVSPAYGGEEEKY